MEKKVATNEGVGDTKEMKLNEMNILKHERI